MKGSSVTFLANIRCLFLAIVEYQVRKQHDHFEVQYACVSMKIKEVIGIRRYLHFTGSTHSNFL